MPNKSEQMKNYFWIILNVVLVIGGLFLLVTGKAIWKNSAAAYPARTISVSAEGKVVVAPDLATLSFSVVSQGKDPVKLQEDNNTKINTAIEFVKSQGVAAADVKTADYNLSPNYHWDEKTRVSSIDGYTLNQTVIVKVRDLSKVASILGGLPARGINQLGGVNFSIDDPDKFLNEAREEAFSKARAKAEAMAKYNGVRLKKVVNFTEYGGGYPGPIYYAKEASMGRGGDMALPPMPTIEPGSQEVTVSVNVTYEIR
ncbi:MAG: hypothetical protein G01um101419_619 [Parcubacteria group bacterium Gr01-1014_19]|nr:MAG: hypothetical protein G01um101419_619 [Parcubacteria group bacterium Gr01-1014_19]